MALKLYNTLTRHKEIFKPARRQAVSLYACGPTVYDDVHLGNWRTFLLSDWLVRVLAANKYRPRLVMNITDVDDKTIAGSQRAGESRVAFAARYENHFWHDLAELNVKRPHRAPHATEHIASMIKMVEKMIVTGHAYVGKDGVYFSIRQAKNYGRLARLGPRTLGTADLADEYETDQVRDFALWKFRQSTDGDNFWPSPWGEGRPGWHIECSAMIAATLGKSIDVHLGGTDLIFPHHTNEIAQTEAVTGEPLARHWIHGAFLLINGQKMSKSLGNIFRLNNLAEKNFSPLDFRYFLSLVHYRQMANLTWSGLAAARVARLKLMDAISDLRLQAGNKKGRSLKIWQGKFIAAINDDLNLPRAVALIWNLVKSRTPAADKLKTLLNWDEVLGLDLAATSSPAAIPTQIKKLVQAREEARQKNDWATADQLRQQVSDLGYAVSDTPTGPQIKKVVNLPHGRTNR
ncbi:MAG: cysteine--tRNA ligase [Patescibacteria group bacterium]